MKFHTFKIVHEINEDDPDRRMQVCDRNGEYDKRKPTFFQQRYFKWRMCIP